MLRATRFASLVLLAGFAAWSLASLHADIAHLPLAPLLRAPELVLAVLLLSLFNYAVRTLRWAAYLRRLGYAPHLRFTALAYLAGFAFTLSPGKLGEVARARWFAAAGVPLPVVAGAFFVERLLDVVAMLALAALILVAFPAYAPQLALLAGLALAAALALLACARLRAGAPRGGTSLLGRLRAGALDAMQASRALLAPAQLAPALLAGLLAWGAEGIGFYLLGTLFPPPRMDVAAGIGMYAVAVVLGAASFLPGGLGSTEAVMITLLKLRGHALEEAVVITLLCRLATLWLAVFLGWGALASLRRRPAAEAL